MEIWSSLEIWCLDLESGVLKPCSLNFGECEAQYQRLNMPAGYMVAIRRVLKFELSKGFLFWMRAQESGAWALI